MHGDGSGAMGTTGGTQGVAGSGREWEGDMESWRDGGEMGSAVVRRGHVKAACAGCGDIAINTLSSLTDRRDISRGWAAVSVSEGAVGVGRGRGPCCWTCSRPRRIAAVPRTWEAGSSRAAAAAAAATTTITGLVNPLAIRGALQRGSDGGPRRSTAVDGGPWRRSLALRRQSAAICA
jgi:hypothetical protein